MLTAQVEDFKPFLDEVKPLLPTHWQELALNKDKVPLDPDYGFYLEQDRQGKALVITLRELGKLVGYFVGFIGKSPHYSQTLSYKMDIFYVLPEHRGHKGGFLMLNALETELKRRGVQLMFLGSKCHKSSEWLFENFGCERIEVYFSKWIGS